MKLLAFETATEACSVAVYDDGAVIERFEIAPRLHATHALPWAAELLARAGIARSQLDAIAISRGPGAFTGVRLAIALAQGIALALDRPVVAISTLQVLAMRAPRIARDGHGPDDPDAGQGDEAHTQRIVAAIDARMGEVYIATFERGGNALLPLSPESVGAPTAVLLPDAPTAWHGVGTGFGAVDGQLARHLASQLATIDAHALPHAADVARLAASAFAAGLATAPEDVMPAYLRNNVALTLEEQRARRALAGRSSNAMR